MDDMQIAKMSLIAKVDKSHEILEDHLDLVNTLNGKVDTSAQLVDENKAFIIEKLRTFELGIVKELREATEHLDLAAYEASFDKIEQDMIAIVKDLGAVRQEVFTDRDDLSKWRNQVTLDLQMFYEKYETKISESGF